MQTFDVITKEIVYGNLYIGLWRYGNFSLIKYTLGQLLLYKIYVKKSFFLSNRICRCILAVSRARISPITHLLQLR